MSPNIQVETGSLIDRYRGFGTPGRVFRTPGRKLENRLKRTVYYTVVF